MAPKKITGAYLRIEFTTNSLRNTTVYIEDDTLYYEIVTHAWQRHLTKISKLDADTHEMVLVAEIERVFGSAARVRGRGRRMDQRTEFHELGLGKAVGVLVSLSSSLLESTDDQRGVKGGAETPKFSETIHSLCLVSISAIGRTDRRGGGGM